MLEQSWEAYATKLANAKDGETLGQVIDDIVASQKINLENKGSVIYGFDTR